MKKILIVVLILVVLGVTLFYFNNPADNPNVNVSPSPTVVEMSVEEYVSGNISALSPIKEQVGGKFFVTSIQTSNGTGTVEYEDGHNAYTADFKYAIDSNGSPIITDFIVKE